VKAKIIALVTLFAGLTSIAKAQTLDVTLLDPDPTVTQGTTSVAFDATIFNPSGQTIFLNGDSFSSVSPLVVDDTPFFNNAPLSLAPGATTAPFVLFDVNLPASTPVGSYANNVFSIFGGGTGAAFDNLSNSSFSVNVASQVVGVPEIGGTASKALTLLAGALAVFCRRRPRA
jgi:hypothetical protein